MNGNTTRCLRRVTSTSPHGNPADLELLGNEEDRVALLLKSSDLGDLRADNESTWNEVRLQLITYLFERLP